MRYTFVFLAFCICLSTYITAPAQDREGFLTSHSFSKTSNEISNLNIKAFCQDSLGYMWIATPRGLNRYNGYEFVQYFHDKNDSTSLSSDFILSVYLDSFHRLWIGTAAGVNRYDFSTNQFIRYETSNIYPYSFFEDHQHQIWAATQIGPGKIDMEKKRVILDSRSKNNYRSTNLIWEDKNNTLWAGLSDTKGLSFCKPDSTWELISLPDERWVTCMYTDIQGMWWLGTNAGLVLFDQEKKVFKEAPAPCLRNSLLNNTLIHFIKEISPLKLLIGTASQGAFLYDIPTQTLSHRDIQQPVTMRSDQLVSCYVDMQEIVWIGSFDQGFTTWSNYSEHFNPDHFLSNTFKNIFVTHVAEDQSGDLWVSTRYHGLFHYSSGKLQLYNSLNSDIFANSNDVLIESLFIDSQNRIWITTTEQLIVGNITRGGRLSIRERKSLKGVGDIAEDNEGNIWIGSISGLYKLEKNLDFTHLEEICQGHVPDICFLSSGDMLFTLYGKGIFRINNGEKRPETYSISYKEAQSVIHQCITLFEDSRKRIWMGSYREGLLCLTSESCHLYTHNNGLPSNDALCIMEDGQGDIWVSTSYGLSRIKSGNTLINYFSNDGLQGNQFHEKAGLNHSDGRIFFAGNHGLTFFNPASVIPNKYPPLIHLEDLKIMNQSVRPAEKGSVLSKNIAFTKHISLNHRQSVIAFDYSGIDFLAPQKLTYAYKLQGFDKEWNHVEHFRRASYSNLSPGNYRFIVKAINGDGVESPVPGELDITVKPAPWLSWQAWTAYAIILSLIVFYLLRLWFKIKLNKQQLTLEQNEREREREVAEMKMTFFTNISHELRTPLTLISAPLEQLILIEGHSQPVQRLLETVSRNVQRLLQLMNQLLDFRKMEAGMLSLKVAPLDLVQSIRNIKMAFEFEAKEKQIDLLFESVLENTDDILLDIDKIEKILHNFLSNAIKHTPARGNIRISLSELSGEEAYSRYSMDRQPLCPYVEVSVADSGPGISPDKMGELFVRYRQLETGGRRDYAGTGIGLHYSKRLVETHKGYIRAQIRDEGGMNFSFILPLGQSVYSDDEKEMHSSTIKPAIEPVISENINQEEETSSHRYSVLVAEDSLELMVFLRNLLSDSYELLEAVDGTEAWEIAQHESPDLIISDVLMPGMNGYLLCEKVKQHPELSHIPVILLTAKSTEYDQIVGLEKGADIYICKPFNVTYLLLSIRNLLQSREKLRNFYSMPQTDKDEEVPVRLSFHDQQFMDKFTILLKAEMSNTDLNINYLSRELGFSRTNFYRKLKGLTDMSPVDFIRSYRLRCAAEMIQEGEFHLNEIAEKTGFGTYSYFSISFKKQFGVSPREYIGK